MAKTKGAQPLVPRGDARTVQALIEGSLRAHHRRDLAMVENYRLYWDLHTIPFPPEHPDQMRAVTGTAGLVVDLLNGALDAPRQSKVFTTSLSQKIQDKAENIESFDNHIWGVLEQQGGRVLHRVDLDQLIYGFGVDALDFYPKRLADGVPKRSLYDSTATGAAAYLKHRHDIVRSKGRPDGALPMVWRHVPARDFYWRPDSESAHAIKMSVELRRRSLGDLLANPRYAKNLPKLVAFFDDLAQRDRPTAGDVMVKFVILETPDTVTYFVLPDTISAEQQASDALLTFQAALQTSYQDGEIADQVDNPLGRSRYIVTPGMESTAEDPGLKYVSVFHHAANPIRTRDAVLSWSVTAHHDFVFAPVVIQRTDSNVNGVKGVPDLPSEGPGGNVDELKLHYGAYKATYMPPGASFQFVANPSPFEKARVLFDVLSQTIDGHTSAQDLMNIRSGSSGYNTNTVIQNVLAKYEPLVTGRRLAHQQRLALLHAQVKALGEPISILAGDQGAAWYALNPDDLDTLELNVLAIYDVERKADEAQGLQNFTEATSSGALDEDTARSTYLHRENHKEIRQKKLLDHFKSMPQVQEMLMLEAARAAQINLQQQRAADAGGVSLEDLLKVTPALAATLGLSVQPGQPGYAAAQGALPALLAQQQSQLGGGQTPGMGQPPQPQGPPTAYPQGPQGRPVAVAPAAQPAPIAPGRRGKPGRAAGAARAPGGPRRTGGL